MRYILAISSEAYKYSGKSPKTSMYAMLQPWGIKKVDSY
jgi:hypothetical protein